MTQKDILQFWRAVEIFNLPDFEEKEKKLLEKGEKLPWEIKTQNSQNKKWKYIITFGKITKSTIVEEIEKIVCKK